MNENIDEATGLPTLPEGYFFRVNGSSVEVRKHVEDGDWSSYDGVRYARNYNGDKTESREVPYDVVLKKRRWYLLGFKQTVVQSRSVTEFRLVNRSEFFADYREVDGKYMSAPELRENSGTPIAVTRLNLLRFAQAAKNRALERIESDELAGDYPPKRFDIGGKA